MYFKKRENEDSVGACANTKDM